MNIPSGGGVCVTLLMHFMVHFTTDKVHLVGGRAHTVHNIPSGKLCPCRVCTWSRSQCTVSAECWRKDPHCTQLHHITKLKSSTGANKVACGLKITKAGHRPSTGMWAGIIREREDVYRLILVRAFLESLNQNP